MSTVREGAFHGGLPYLATGTGPPLVVLGGLSPTHTIPVGFDRRMQLRIVRPLVDRFTVYLTNRRPGLEVGTTMTDLAADVAAAIEDRFSSPIPVEGVSTGGCIAQQLAIDHPHLVDRLVLASTAYRLGPKGQRGQRRLATFTRAGRPRAAWAALGPPSSTATIGGWLMAALMWLTGPYTHPDDPSDMLAAIEAEDTFDAYEHLHRITAPTLVVCGDRDGFYGPDLAADTAARIPDARLIRYPGKGHIGVLTHPPAQQAIRQFLLATG